MPAATAKIPEVQNQIIENATHFLKNHRIVALAGPRGSNPDQLISAALKKAGLNPVIKDGQFDPNNKKFSFHKDPVYIYKDCGSLLENQPLPRPINIPVVLTTMTERQRIAGTGKFLLPAIQRRTIAQLMQQEPRQNMLADKTVTLEKLEAISRVPPALLAHIGVIETETNIGVIATETLTAHETTTPAKINATQRPIFLETLYAQTPLFQDHQRFPRFSETIRHVAECYHKNITHRDWTQDYPNRALLTFFNARTHSRPVRRPVPQFREALIERCEQHKLLLDTPSFNPYRLIPDILGELAQQATAPENQHLRDYGILFDRNRGGTSIRRRRKPPSQSSASSPV